MCTIRSLQVDAYTIPTDAPEADGTIAWDRTTLITVQLSADGKVGLGYTYADSSAAYLIEHTLAHFVIGRDAMCPRALSILLNQQVRNIGREGVASTAISAIDVAVWDLKARLLNVPITALLSKYRKAIPVYGSGGFTSYDDQQLTDQLGGWVAQGITAVKMKVGSHPERDVARVRLARAAIGDAELFVDANGAFDLKQAAGMAEAFAEHGVTWFEEPVSSDDLLGLRELRDLVPSSMEIAAGEYGYTPLYFRRMLESKAVDVLQADATRCGGVTGFLHAAALADAFCTPLSAHTSPTLHGHLCCVTPRARHVEYFHDHVRIEGMLFDGALTAKGGSLQPEGSTPGFGLTVKRQDADAYRVYSGQLA